MLGFTVMTRANSPLDLPRAAVLLLLDGYDSDKERLLLTKRADFLRTHPGEVSFPGGMIEHGDEGSLERTALRESEEEVGLQASKAEILSSLPVRQSRHGVAVKPHVATMKEPHILTASRDELQCLFWVPTALFREDKRVKTLLFPRPGGDYDWAPVYQFDGHTIWGLTAKIIVDFVYWRYRILLPRRHADAPDSIFSGFV